MRMRQIHFAPLRYFKGYLDTDKLVNFPDPDKRVFFRGDVLYVYSDQPQTIEFKQQDGSEWASLN